MHWNAWECTEASNPVLVRITKKQAQTKPRKGARTTHDGRSDGGVPQGLSGLPRDPPTVQGTMKRTITLVLTGTSAASTATITYDTIGGLIDKQLFGGTTAFARYVVKSVRVWGAPGDGTAIHITDSLYGIGCVDSGSYADRPKVGIYYPPSTRQVKSTSTTGDLVTLGTATDASNYIALITVAVWTIPTFDF
jgi:hypothetical protein